MGLFSKVFGKKTNTLKSEASMNTEIPAVMTGSDRNLQAQWAKGLLMQKTTGTIKPIMAALKNGNSSIREKMSSVLSELASDNDSIRAFSTHLKDSMEVFLLIGVLKEISEKDTSISTKEKAKEAWMKISHCINQKPQSINPVESSKIDQAYSWHDKGHEQIKCGKLKEAYICFEKAVSFSDSVISTNPKNPDAYFVKALSAGLMGNIQSQLEGAVDKYLLPLSLNAWKKLIEVAPADYEQSRIDIAKKMVAQFSDLL